MKLPPLSSALAAIGLLLAAASSPAQTATRADFGWRARLELPPAASVVRLSLPADALLQLQSSDASDVRVFNAAGEAVPFARMPVPPAAAAVASLTRDYPALALHTEPAGPGRPKGSVQVRVDEGGRQRSVWVQVDGSAPGAGGATKAALFDTRGEHQTLTALMVQATLPPNTAVPIRVSSSADLAQWKQLPVRGRLYRFQGAGAPANDTLEFDSPIQLKDRYLRLDWDPQAPVAIQAVAGRVAPAAAAPPRLRAPLPTPQPADKGALEIPTGFLTPLAAVALSTPTANTLLPVRILGRNDAAQPWRPLAQTVIYRLGNGAGEGVNPPVALHGWSGRWLRIESISGADLGLERIQAEAEFAPMQLVFVATGAGPFDLAFSRAATAPAAVALATIASALGQQKLEDLPEARVGAARRQEPAKGPLFGWASVTAPGQRSVLWGVLILGVLILAGVAWSLLRQLKADTPKR